jgi:hypothetical protein
MVRQTDSETNTYTLRVKCDKKQWLKASGEEKQFKYFTVGQRTMKECPEYTPMGNPLPYKNNLKKDLPLKDEVYGKK